MYCELAVTRPCDHINKGFVVVVIGGVDDDVVPTSRDLVPLTRLHFLALSLVRVSQ